MTPARILAALLAVVMTAGTAWLSRVEVDVSGGIDGMIRLSWRVDGITAEACRELSEEELNALPVHMRNPRACIGEIAPYLLRAEVDGVELVHDTVAPGGVRGDRPVSIFRELPVTPGRHRLAVRFDAVLPEGFEVGDAPVSRGWEGEVEVAESAVLLLTLNDRGDFIIRQ